LLTEDGHVNEGASCKLFMVRDGSLITPPASQNILEGITRDTVMELARRELNPNVVERPIDRSELYICDEVFSPAPPQRSHRSRASITARSVPAQ
jgi:branched-chain amino acid aminotransferase